ncbi:hypothetical protein YC2023_106608 [Brassica napus]
MRKALGLSDNFSRSRPKTLVLVKPKILLDHLETRGFAGEIVAREGGNRRKKREIAGGRREKWGKKTCFVSIKPRVRRKLSVGISSVKDQNDSWSEKRSFSWRRRLRRLIELNDRVCFCSSKSHIGEETESRKAVERQKKEGPVRQPCDHPGEGKAKPDSDPLQRRDS